MHRVRLALSQVKAPSQVQPGREIPRISTGCAQDRRCCAQVIHMFVHREQGSGPSYPQRISAPLLTCPLRR
jgi:hypothetical protein